MGNISQIHLLNHLQMLTLDIGVRLAGTPGEKSAADYIAQQFRQSGANVTIDTFPVKSRHVREQHLEILTGDRWETFPCSLFSSTPGTDGRRIEAPLNFFEAPTEYQRSGLSYLRDKAVVHLGCHIESRAAYRRLMQARPAFLLFVDVRYPGTTPRADGMFPSYTRDLGAVPTVDVAFMDAWRWKAEGASSARLRVVGGMEEAESQNVVASLPGSEPDSGTLFLGAHHDTQADSVGADDNASGVVGLLELARVLAPLPRRRTIHLISFGAEEQLSVGSATYVRRHRQAIVELGRLMFNLDSYGSGMGWTELVCNGPRQLKKVVTPFFQARHHYVRFISEICPYADHFPFVAAGVPGIWLSRKNMTAGRFFHHLPDDDITRVCPNVMSTILDGVAEFIYEMANTPELPFPSSIPGKQADAVRGFWEDLYGGFAV